MIRAIIIDDQQLAINELKEEIVENVAHDVQVIGESTSFDEAVLLFKEYKPDLIFLDVDLRGKTGFDFLNEIRKFDHKEFEVIFTTAFNQFAIKAFKFSAFDYLLKPVLGEDLVESIKRLKLENNQNTKQKINTLLGNKKELNTLTVSVRDKIHYIKLEEIIRIEADHNYSNIVCTSKQVFVSKTIKVYEELLKDSDFLRVHQSHLVNKRFISSFLKEDGGYLLLSNEDKIPVSAKKKDAILEELKNS